MQRTPRPYSSYESHGSPPSRLPHRCTAIGRAVGVRGGRRPSGGSITSDVRRDVVLYSRQCGIGAVAPCTRPDRTSTGARSCSSRTRTSCRRFAYSSSVRNCRVPYCAGRSNGTPYSLSVVHSPCRSGSPHGVRARRAVSLPVCAPAASVVDIRCADTAIANTPATIVPVVLAVITLLAQFADPNVTSHSHIANRVRKGVEYWGLGAFP